MKLNFRVGCLLLNQVSYNVNRIKFIPLVPSQLHTPKLGLISNQQFLQLSD